MEAMLGFQIKAASLGRQRASINFENVSPAAH